MAGETELSLFRAFHVLRCAHTGRDWGDDEESKKCNDFSFARGVMDGRITTTTINRMLAPIKKNTTVEGNIIR